MQVTKNQTFDARQWFCAGDHPQVGVTRKGISNPDMKCPECGKPRKDHGYLPFNFPICPGDWIVDDGFAVGNEYVFVRHTQEEFDETFEKVPE